MKTELTIEQSRRLIELGVSADKASKEMATTIGEQEYSDPRHPIFTLADLLGILPKEVKRNYAQLTIIADDGGWCLGYNHYCSNDTVDTIKDCYAPELIDALYELTIWLIENKLIQQ